MKKILNFMLIFCLFTSNFIISKDLNPKKCDEKCQAEKKRDIKIVLIVTGSVSLILLAGFGLVGYKLWKDAVENDKDIPKGAKEEFTSGLPKENQLEKAYKMLGLSEKSTRAELNSAFRKLSVKYHPDKHPENRELYQEKMKELAKSKDVVNAYMDSTFKKIQGSNLFNDVRKAQKPAEFQKAVEVLASKLGISASSILSELEGTSYSTKFESSWEKIKSNVKETPLNPEKLATQLEKLGLNQASKTVKEQALIKESQPDLVTSIQDDLLNAKLADLKKLNENYSEYLNESHKTGAQKVNVNESTSIPAELESEPDYKTVDNDYVLL
ncbi:MAG: DnaJ domain-containing protein [Candidatus Babeliales bacterium]|nr:DnaJ domain-containing protein [Candidatus Babeliales bacterium]